VFINAYLYSVYGSVKAATRRDARLVAYRNRWLDALLVGRQVEAVLALGQAADQAWQAWRATEPAQGVAVAYAAITHPTQPESDAAGDQARLAASTRKLLQNWNAALRAVAPSVLHPDTPTPLVPYGERWADGDRPAIACADLPAGLPAWMAEHDGWARRAGRDALAKRRNITLTVPKGVVA
jgi:hypothetical protein